MGRPIVIVGDSYARATGATEKALGYPSVVRQTLGLEVRVVALGGTGFINTGNHRGNHQHRRWLVPSHRKALVIQSSANDRFYEKPEIIDAMNRYLSRMRGESPICITSAIWCGEDDRDRLPIVTSAAAAVADEHGLSFLDASKWFEDADRASLFHVDGHPTDLGHRVIGNEVSMALRSILSLP